VIISALDELIQELEMPADIVGFLLNLHLGKMAIFPMPNLK
jgi:hypothetical protein